MTRALDRVTVRCAARRRARWLRRTRTQRPRATRATAADELSDDTERHRSTGARRPDRRRPRRRPSSVSAASRPVVRDALGQLGLAIAASQQRALARLADRRPRADSCARTRAAPDRRQPRARQARHRAAPSPRSTSRAGHAQAAGIVVTREQTYTDGRADLGGRRYRVYLIRLTREPNGWGVSAWEPQP